MKLKETISSFWQKFRRKDNYLLPAFILPLCLLAFNPAEGQVIRKSRVEFTGKDSLLITADHYYSLKENPYILLFHTEMSSRGEFDSLAERFAKMQLNCLSVDIRTGNKYGYTKNETAEKALLNGKDTRFPAAENDIIASIEYAQSLNQLPVLLYGSSSSASLCIKLMNDIPGIGGVLAFSPGESFLTGISMDSLLNATNLPVFITGSPIEQSYLESMASQGMNSHISYLSPPENATGRGTELLHKSNPARDEYWMAVLIFIKSIKNRSDGEVPVDPL